MRRRLTLALALMAGLAVIVVVAGCGSSSGGSTVPPPNYKQALKGAQAFDTGRLRAEFGFVFDHATPIGEIIVASPTYYRLEARMHGAAAHADGIAATLLAGLKPA